MSFRRKSIAAAILLTANCLLANDPPSLFDPARHMRTSEVRAGMTGYGLSVISGTKIEKFDVEVISVLKNQMGPLHDIVLIRCRGMGLEHSGAVEGMSGSPIYLKDDAGNFRMIGAFALGWEYSKDPVAGVRPIEEMLDIPTDPRPVPARAIHVSRSWNASNLIRNWLQPGDQARTLVRSQPVSASPSQLRPLGTPLAIGGLDRRQFDRLAPEWAQLGFTPLQAASSGAGIGGDGGDGNAKLEPGAAIALPVVTGDFELSAIGTVTEVIGDRLWAFGHEYNSEGGVDLPMGVARIDTVISSNQISFKMGSLVRLGGGIHSDEATGIAGRIGKLPRTIPMDVIVRTGQRDGQQKYHFELVKHPKLTPMGVSTALAAALQSHSNLPGDFTVAYKMTMSFENGRSISVANTATSANHAPELGRDLALPLTLAIDNPFGQEFPTGVQAEFDLQPEARVAEIRSAATDKSIYKPGQTARLFVTTLQWKGGESTREIDIKLPESLPDGQYTLTVGDAARFLGDSLRDEPYRFEVRTVGEVFSLIEQITDCPSTRLYTRLSSQAQGVSVGRTALSGLPASRLKLFAITGRADVMPFTESVKQQTEWGGPLSGSTDLIITIAADSDKAQRPHNVLPGGPPTLPAPAAQDTQPPKS